MEQVALQVANVNSSECERVVASALINVPGVQWASAASPSGVVGVQFDPGITDLSVLLDAVEAAGYHSVPDRATSGQRSGV